MADSRLITREFENAQSSLVIQASDLSLESISGMVRSLAIDIRPEFQRRERWNTRQASSLIESFLLNIPVPPVYLAEEDFGRYAVIDGKQRIGAIQEFMSNSLELVGLRRFENINGLRFEQLPPELRNALQVRPYLRVITLLRQSDPLVKYEVFHRLNSGGEPLNAQEIRNVIFRGPVNDTIMRLSEQKFLRNRLKIRDSRSSAYRTMQDVEYVLRFLTLRQSWANFGGDFRIAMDKFMEANRRAEVDEFEQAFVRALNASAELWDDVAFQRFDGRQWRDQILGGVYDAQMIAIDALTDREIRALARKREDVVEQTKELFGDEHYDASVRTSTNTPSRLKYRVERTIDMLQSIL